MAKPVCLRYYKFMHAAKIHRKFCSPRLYTKNARVEKQGSKDFAVVLS